MDEVELVKSFGDVWDEAGDIIEAMQALGKRIETLHVGEPADESHADIHRLIAAQVDLVFSTLRVTLARVENGIRPAAASTPAPTLAPAPTPSVSQPAVDADAQSDVAPDEEPDQPAPGRDHFHEVVAAE